MVLRADELARLPNTSEYRPTQITIFYATAAQEQTVTRGPFVLSLAQRAAPAVKPQSPVIVISHGSGGGAIPWIDLARQLVQAGFVVAVPKHSGDNSEDQTDVGPASWRKRPLELSATLDALAAQPLWSGLLDVQRAGVFGMSAGGHTALVLAGGVWSELRYGDHCRKNLEQDFNTCVGLMMHLSGRPTDALKLAGAKAVLAVRNTDPAPLSHADSRFKAAVASVPMAAPFAPETLAQPRIPLGFMRAELDTWLHPKFHSDAITAQCLPRQSCTMISDWPKGGHGSPLSPWPPELAKSISPLMADPPGFDRAAAVPKAYADVVAFFLKHVR
jgi:predicted dienelactone hydrolase